MHVTHRAIPVCAAALALCACALDRRAQAAEEVSLDGLLAAVSSYRGGESRKALIQLERVVAAASKDPAKARPLARRLAGVLEAPKATREAKVFVCRQLWVVGGAEQVPVLARLLADEELSHLARYVLQPLREPAVGAALRDALGRVKGKLLVGVIDTIGERGDLEALDALARLLGHEDEGVAAAAATALGKLPEPRAAQALAAARGQAKGTFRRQLTQAWLHSGEALLRAGKKGEAAAIFEKLFAGSEVPHVRIAALRGRLATLQANEAVKTLVGLVGGDDPQMRAVAIGYLAEMADPSVANALADLLPKSAPPIQRVIVDALATRGDRAAAPAVAALARESRDPSVRLAAVEALGRLGDASSVGLLATLSTVPEAELRAAARQSLVALPGKETDSAILAAVEGAEEPVRIELIRSLRDRRATALAERIAAVAADDKSAAVRSQCFAALADLASGEHLGLLVERMVKEGDIGARAAAERAVLAVARRADEPSKCVAPILAAHAKADGPSRAATLRVLGKLGGAEALAAVRADLHHRDDAVAEVALRALAEWPDAAAAEELLALARSAKSPTHRILALRGAIRAIGLPSQRPRAETIAMHRQALGLATRPEEKKLVLAGLASFPHPESLKLARACASDPALKAEAEQALRKIQATLDKPTASASHNPQAAHYAVDGDPETRWKSLVNQSRDAGIWFALDLRAEKTIRRIALVGNQLKPADYVREYEVYISNDPAKWGKPVVTGKGTGTISEIAVPPTTGRYVRIASTGSAGHNWSIYEIQIDGE